MTSIETFGIIGSGEFGALAARSLAPRRAEVLMYDRDEHATFPKNVSVTDLSSVLEADAVMLAVPFDSYDELIEPLQNAPEETLLVDVCSVKLRPTWEFQESGLFDRPNVLLTHPLFGPQTVGHRVKGNKIVVTEAHGERAEALLDIWGHKKVAILEATASDHDEAMAEIQALPFFIGRTLIKYGLDRHDELATNYFRQLLKLKLTEEQHSHELFMTIQKHNPFAAKTRLRFMFDAIETHASIPIEAYPPNMDITAEGQLENLREMIDLVDGIQTDLPYVRLQLTDQVGDVKAWAGLPMKDRERERVVLREAQERAEERGLPEDLVKALTQYNRRIMSVTAKRNAAQHTESELPETALTA